MSRHSSWFTCSLSPPLPACAEDSGQDRARSRLRPGLPQGPLTLGLRCHSGSPKIVHVDH